MKQDVLQAWEHRCPRCGAATSTMGGPKEQTYWCRPCRGLEPLPDFKLPEPGDWLPLNVAARIVAARMMRGRGERN